MKQTLVRLILLCSLAFNITHAAVIAMEDDHTACHHSKAVSFVVEQDNSDDCGDLCKLHHLFHFNAVVDNVQPAITLPAVQESPVADALRYTPPFKTTEHKPPIA
jgi:hypothetical protein